MKPLKQFNEFLGEGIIKKRTPDKERAKFMIEDADNSYKFLLEMIKKIEITNINANSFVKVAYDSIMEMIRAIMLLKGFSSSGLFAHEAEVSYLRELAFSEAEVNFANQLRYFRNGTMYYGTILDAEYAKKASEFAKETYPKLKKLVKI